MILDFTTTNSADMTKVANGLSGLSCGVGCGCGCDKPKGLGSLNDLWCGKDSPTTGFFCLTPVDISTNFGGSLTLASQDKARALASDDLSALNPPSTPIDPLNSLANWVSPVTTALNVVSNPNTSLVIAVAALIGAVVLLRR